MIKKLISVGVLSLNLIPIITTTTTTTARQDNKVYDEYQKINKILPSKLTSFKFPKDQIKAVIKTTTSTDFFEYHYTITINFEEYVKFIFNNPKLIIADGLKTITKTFTIKHNVTLDLTKDPIIAATIIKYNANSKLITIGVNKDKQGLSITNKHKNQSPKWNDETLPDDLKYIFRYVTHIGPDAFKTSRLTTLNLPKVTSIGSNAFRLSNFTILNLPKVTDIGNGAFYNSPLIKWNLPKLSNIGSKYTFWSTTNPPEISRSNLVIWA